MHLKKLHLLHFKNYDQSDLEFSPRVNCFTGNNGSGKTNLLDAVHYLAMCKSAFNASDSQNIQHGKDYFMIQGSFSGESGDENVYCSFKKGEKKQFKINLKEYSRLADHIGKFPLVLVSPEDSLLVTGGSEERRRLMDSTIAQYDKTYLENIVSYNKVLNHRNALLKDFARNKRYNKDSLDAWDLQLADMGDKIHSTRAKFLHEFIPYFKKYFALLTDGEEEAGIEYLSQLAGKKLGDLLGPALERDRFLQYTSVGTHKDDILFTLNSYAVKKFGSQGQQKSFLSSIKLAQYEFLKEKKGKKPILLLDDIFDKLDDLRVERLMRIVGGEEFGQIFLTDTHPERAAQLFRKTGMDPLVLKMNPVKV